MAIFDASELDPEACMVCVHRSTYSKLELIAPIVLAALLWAWKSVKLFEYGTLCIL